MNTILCTAFLTSGAVACVVMAAPAAAQDRNFDVPAQSAVTGVAALARQGNIQIFAARRDTRGKRTNAVRGAMSVERALTRLLDGTGLVARRTGDQAFTVVAASVPVAASTQSGPSGQADAGEAAENDREILVTGSRIRGAQPSSPVVTVTRRDIQQAGQNSLGEALRALPQNFSGGQNPEVGIGMATTGNLENQNVTGGSAFNLRGLGGGATLTLLNGARVPYDGIYQVTDVAAIPAAAIERMEVLLDGASAVYGSDAVAGVVNIVLRRDYDGAEFTGRYGFSTDGGNEQQQYTAVLGQTWGSGGFIVTGDYSKNTRILMSDRDYQGYFIDQNVSLYPEITQKGVVFSGHQALGPVEFTLEGYYSKRNLEQRGYNGVTLVEAREAETWSISPGIRVTLPSDWSLRIDGSIGVNDARIDQTQLVFPSGAFSRREQSCLCNEAKGATIDAEGPLFTLPGGSARVAVGAGYRHNAISNFGVRTIGTVATSFRQLTGERSNKFAYGEIALPIVSEAQGIPLLSKLSLNGAVRYEDYSDFGDVATPKFGAVWGLIPGFELRGSWGKSFKAPALRDLYLPSFITYRTAASLGQNTPGATALYLNGANRDLGPERAEVLNLGVVVAPPAIPGLRVEIGYFDTDYTDRIAQPLASNALGAALVDATYAEFVTRNPTVAQQNAAFAAAGLPVGTFSANQVGQPYNAANVIAIVNNLNTNVSRQRARGVDLIVSYRTSLFGGTLNLSGNASWLDGSRQLTLLSPSLPTAGINFFPAEFKARAGASWTSAGFTVASTFNHIGGVKNVFLASRPMGDSMNTIDLVLNYQTENGALGGFEIGVAATNLFNARPPYLPPIANFYTSYDPTNYSAIGRTLNFTVTKRF